MRAGVRNSESVTPFGFILRVGKTDLQNPNGEFDETHFENGYQSWYDRYVDPIIEMAGPGFDLAIWHPWGTWPGYGHNGASFAFEQWVLASEQAPILTQDFVDVFSNALSSGELNTLAMMIGYAQEEIDPAAFPMYLEPILDLNDRFPGRIRAWFDRGSGSVENDRHHQMIQFLASEGVLVGNEAIPKVTKPHLLPYDSLAIERFFLGQPGRSVVRWTDEDGWIHGTPRFTPDMHATTGTDCNWLLWGSGCQEFTTDEAYLDHIRSRTQLGFRVWFDHGEIRERGGGRFLKKVRDTGVLERPEEFTAPPAP